MATQFRRLFALTRSQYWFLLIESISACHILNNCHSYFDLMCEWKGAAVVEWHPSITNFVCCFFLFFSSSKTYLHFVRLEEFVTGAVARRWRTRWQMSVAANSWRLSEAMCIDGDPFLQTWETEIEGKYLSKNRRFYDASTATRTLSIF